MSLIYSPNPVVDESLLLYLDAANIKSYDRSSTTWFDLGKTRKDGTLTNGPTFDAANGGSILLDLTNDYVAFNDPVIIPDGSDFTISIFLNPTFGTTNPGIFRDTVSNTTFYFTTTTLYPSVTWCGTDILLPSSGWSASAGSWTHYTFVVRSATNVQFYENAVIKHQANHTKSTTQISIPFIGYQFTPSYKVAGNWASVQMYSRALSDEEIKRNFNALGGRFGLWA
jgi:hypothetical protein